MFASLFKRLGFSKKKNDKPKDDLNEQIKQSVESFKNRIIHKKLTMEIIADSSDDQLLQMVFDNLIEKFPDDYTKEYEMVKNLFKGTAGNLHYLVFGSRSE